MGVETLETSANAARKPIEVTTHLLDELLNGGAKENIGVRLWGGACWPDDKRRPTTAVLKHPGALRSMFLSGMELGPEEAYLCDDFDIEGNVEDVFALADTLAQDVSGNVPKLRSVQPAPASRGARRQNHPARPGEAAG